MTNTFEQIGAEDVLKEYDLNNTYAAQQGYSCEGFQRWVGWTPTYLGETPLKLHESFDTSHLGEKGNLLRQACLVHVADCMGCQEWVISRKNYVEWLKEELKNSNKSA